MCAHMSDMVSHLKHHWSSHKSVQAWVALNADELHSCSLGDTVKGAVSFPIYVRT